MANNKKLVKLLDTSGNNQTLAIVVIEIGKKKKNSSIGKKRQKVSNYVVK